MGEYVTFSDCNLAAVNMGEYVTFSNCNGVTANMGECKTSPSQTVI